MALEERVVGIDAKSVRTSHRPMLQCRITLIIEVAPLVNQGACHDSIGKECLKMPWPGNKRRVDNSIACVWPFRDIASFERAHQHALASSMIEYRLRAPSSAKHVFARNRAEGTASNGNPVPVGRSHDRPSVFTVESAIEIGLAWPLTLRR